MRRVARKNPDGGELWFLHAGLNILMDQATDGTPWASYNQGIGIDKLVSVVEWTGQSAPRTRYYHADAIGSVRSLTDEGAGQVGTYAYDAWGNVTASSGSEANEYKFTSRRTVPLRPVGCNQMRKPRANARDEANARRSAIYADREARCRSQAIFH